MPLSIRHIIVNIVCQLYAALYIYAAISKLLTFHDFKVQLAQSPLLTAFVSWVAIAVPVLELFIASLLLIPRLRLLGLFLAYSLMAMFTAYIYIITNYSAFVPCSCGGILEEMTWDQHLVFNVVFMVLAVVAVLFQPLTSDRENKHILS